MTGPSRAQGSRWRPVSGSQGEGSLVPATPQLSLGKKAFGELGDALCPADTL